MVKFWLYSSASLVACAGLLWYTYMTRMQFYPAVIYLVTSKISILILGNAGLVLTILFAKLVKSIFLGSLRDAEVEILHENVRYAITETCLALTIFRDEINFQVVVLFTSLIFLKVFHWLSQSRIEFIEQTDVVTRVTHMRLVALMSILAAMDMAFVVVCGMKVMEMGASVFILFGFEFLILLVSLIAIFLRYVLYVIDARMDGNWTNKFTYLFYLELISEICKLVIYLVFFMLIFTYYGMPLHIVRDLWMSIKNLQRRIASYFRYRKITANLNERFPNPTEEELQGTDRTCIICREEMTAEACKKLPCSHIFHIDCLKMWVQRQQTCPTCRSTIPTGVRPPVVPEAPPNPAPPAPPAAAPVAPAVAPVPAAAPPAPGAPPPQHPAAPAAHGAYPPGHRHHHATPGAHALPAAHAAPQMPPFPPGYPSPFMSPLMFGPGLGAPFGYGFPPGYGTMPPFGFHGAQPGASVPDSTMIQHQIEMLHAQLAALQAATQAYGMQMPLTPPPHASPAASAASSSQAVSTAAPAASPAMPVTHAAASTAPSSAEQAQEELEEKAAVRQEVAQANAVSQAVEQEIPRMLTEAERRREELRNRYARIYSANRSGSDEEHKSDDAYD